MEFVLFEWAKIHWAQTQSPIPPQSQVIMDKEMRQSSVYTPAVAYSHAVRRVKDIVVCHNSWRLALKPSHFALWRGQAFRDVVPFPGLRPAFPRFLPSLPSVLSLSSLFAPSLSPSVACE